LEYELSTLETGPLLGLMIARIPTLLAEAITVSQAAPGYTYKGTIIFTGSEATEVRVHKSVLDGGEVGLVVGAEVGLVVGAEVGLVVGAEVGLVVGAEVGLVVGAEVGLVVGAEVGVLGLVVGEVGGAVVGLEVGLAVGVDDPEDDPVP
jgi:hypothetical protein